MACRLSHIDVETYVRCGKAVRVIASIEEPALIERILGHAGGREEHGIAWPAVDRAAGERASGVPARRTNRKRGSWRSRIGRGGCCVAVGSGGITAREKGRDPELGDDE